VSKRLILFAFGDCSASFQTSYIYIITTVFVGRWSC